MENLIRSRLVLQCWYNGLRSPEFGRNSAGMVGIPAIFFPDFRRNSGDLAEFRRNSLILSILEILAFFQFFNQQICGWYTICNNANSRGV